MWQSIGWNNATWLPCLKTIACWWTSVVVLLFILQAVVFTLRANEQYYLTDGKLQLQYEEMYREHYQEKSRTCRSNTCSFRKAATMPK